MRPDNSIVLEQLSRRFKEKVAVEAISLQVRPGEIYGFLGPNGAGKSTTVAMLTTLLPPSAGRAFVGGCDVVRQAAQVRAMIGVALQSIALDPVLTGREHLHFQAALYGMPKRAREGRAETLLARVGLLEAASRKISTYSGGMKRRLDLALALLHEPRILFLDEPTTGLDPQSRQLLWQEIVRLARNEGVTIFLTTQYLEEADVLADRVAIIHEGRLVAEDTPGQLKADVGSHSLYVYPAAAGDQQRAYQVLGRFGCSALVGDGGDGATPRGISGGTRYLAAVG